MDFVLYNSQNVYFNVLHFFHVGYCFDIHIHGSPPLKRRRQQPPADGALSQCYHYSTSYGTMKLLFFGVTTVYSRLLHLATIYDQTGVKLVFPICFSRVQRSLGLKGLSNLHTIAYQSNIRIGISFVLQARLVYLLSSFKGMGCNK